MINEGYIKFNSVWEKAPAGIPETLLAEINEVRSLLIEKGYLGVLPNGIGFGNISVRDGQSDHFFITGSATGGFPVLQSSHIALVESADIARNALVCRGLTAASSESMSHAIIYQSVGLVNAVVHIHSASRWKKYYNQFPTTEPSAEFGTPEMAFSIERLTKKIQSSSGIIIMGGHEDGIIAYANTIYIALQQLIEL